MRIELYPLPPQSASPIPPIKQYPFLLTEAIVFYNYLPQTIPIMLTK